MLTWKNNTPLFSLHGELGNSIIMFFGEVMFDGFTFSEFRCRVLLFEYNETWSVKKGKMHRLLNEGNEEPDVEMFISELQSAVDAHMSFDFSNYWNYWNEVDPHFHAFVLDTSKHAWSE